MFVNDKELSYIEHLNARVIQIKKDMKNKFINLNLKIKDFDGDYLSDFFFQREDIDKDMKYYGNYYNKSLKELNNKIENLNY